MLFKAHSTNIASRCNSPLTSNRRQDFKGAARHFGKKPVDCWGSNRVVRYWWLGSMFRPNTSNLMAHYHQTLLWHIFADLSTPQQPVSGCCTQKKLLVPNQARTNRRGLCVFTSLMLGAQSQVKLLMGSCITTLLPVLTFNQAEYTSVYVNNGIYVLCLCGIGGNRDFVMQPCFVAWWVNLVTFVELQVVILACFPPCLLQYHAAQTNNCGAAQTKKGSLAASACR